MKIYFKSRLTPTVKVFDSESQGGGLAEKILRPAVYITDDGGRILWSQGDPGQSLFPVIVMGLFLILLWRLS